MPDRCCSVWEVPRQEVPLWRRHVQTTHTCPASHGHPYTEPSKSDFSDLNSFLPLLHLCVCVCVCVFGRDGTATGKGGLCICLVLFIKKKDPKTIWQNIYVTAGLTGVNVTI